MQTSSGVPRYTLTCVSFSRPFSLGADPEVYPAGPYDVETAEELFEINGHTTRIRTSTVLIVPTPSGAIHREIRGRDLDKALEQDAEGQEQRGLSENPDRGEVD